VSTLILGIVWIAVVTPVFFALSIVLMRRRLIR
jgi:hypothetical protein